MAIIILVVVSACNTPYSQNPLRKLIPAPSSELGLSFSSENEGVSGGVLGSAGVVSRYEQVWEGDDTKLWMEILEFDNEVNAVSYVAEYGEGGVCDYYDRWPSSWHQQPDWNELAQVDEYSWCEIRDITDDYGNFAPNTWDAYRLRSGRYVAECSVDDADPRYVSVEGYFLLRGSSWELLQDQVNAMIPGLCKLSQSPATMSMH
jgi:hypothetical protein